MWIFRRFEKACFPQENEKNHRVTLISHKLISVTLKACSVSRRETPPNRRQDGKRIASLSSMIYNNTHEP
ncbi:MAG: hypothetical protein LBI86_03885, partial [Treponema sp.]|nr:hypothetical protein [Treponema sp.]